MNKKRVFNSVDSFFNIIFYLAKINLYFWLFTIRGLVVFGFFPSLVALLNIIERKDVKEVHVTIKKEFKEKYKEKFWQANLVGGIIFFIGGALYLNYLILLNNIGRYSILIVFSFFTILLLFLIVTLWIFPLLVQENLKTKDAFKYSLIIGLTNIHYTLVISVGVFIILYISLTFPSFLLFFTQSLIGFLIMTFTRKPMVKFSVLH